MKVLNPNGPGCFKTQAGNPDLQTCYFNLDDDYHRYNLFISKRINTDVDNNEVYFNIEGRVRRITKLLMLKQN